MVDRSIDSRMIVRHEKGIEDPSQQLSITKLVSVKQQTHANGMQQRACYEGMMTTTR